LSLIELKRVVLANGETMGYRERVGGNKVILFVHGNMTSSKHWDVVFENMDAEYKLIAIDLRGFGASSYNTPINSLKDFAIDLKLFVDQIGLSTFTLIGWSTGGGVAMHFAIDNPHYVDKLILLASVSTRGYRYFKADVNGKLNFNERISSKEEMRLDTLRAIPIQSAYDRRDKDALKRVWEASIYTQNQPEAERYAEYVEDMLTQRNLVDVYHALNTFNISKHSNGLVAGSGEADRLRTPTLVLQGRNDLVVRDEMALEIMDDINHTAELVYLENCGHSPLIDDLDQLLQVVTKFIGK
jgi:pimeloyl-ACP methyl ester carboxylesterase